MRPSIYFFCEDISFRLPLVKKIRDWLNSIVEREKGTLVALNYIFCSDAFLLRLNVEYLGHDTLTDVITFDNTDELEGIQGDIYISIERIRENAAKYRVPFEAELHRVMVHGLLHLLGYGDKTVLQKKMMRKKELTYLSLKEF
jgi:probable rRNA maturation factor